MREPSDGRVVFREERGDFLRRQFGWQASVFGSIDQAVLADEMAGAGKRSAHEPAPAFARAASERHHRAEREQIARDIVLRRDRQERGLFLVRLVSEAVRGLNDGVVAAPMPPWTFVAPGAQRYIHDAGPHFGERFRREAVACQRAGPIRLRENVARSHELTHQLRFARIAQIDVRLELADARVEVGVAKIGEIFTRHAKDVGAMLGERARARGARENACEIEHADAGERTLARRQRLGRGIANLDDLEERQIRDRVHLGQRTPFFFAAHEASAPAALEQRVLQFESVPLGDR